MAPGIFPRMVNLALHAGLFGQALKILACGRPVPFIGRSAVCEAHESAVAEMRHRKVRHGVVISSHRGQPARSRRAGKRDDWNTNFNQLPYEFLVLPGLRDDAIAAPFVREGNSENWNVVGQMKEPG